MRLTWLLLLTLVLVSPAGDLMAQERVLSGQVVLVGPQDELTPAVGVDVTLVQRGDTVRTKAQGLFRLFLPQVFKPGETITLAVDKPDWRIQYPLDGKVRIPAEPGKDPIEIRLLPIGSRKFWSDDRIEKFIADTAEKAKQEVEPGGRPEDIDFGRYIQAWAAQYGFSAAEARAEIDQWVAEAQRNQDLYKLGLAAYAEKNFGKAGTLFDESAENKHKRREEVRREHAALTEEIVRDLRLAGDAHYSNYAFAEALDRYQQALKEVDRETRPQLWAAIHNDIGLAHWEIGIRTEGEASRRLLVEAVTAYRHALEVYTRDTLPQDWAMTQNNLGIALREQATRTEGEASQRLLVEAVAAYRAALEVRTRDTLPQDWAATQHNLGLALREQATRTEGEEGRRLLAEAVTAYRAALEVYTRDQLPQHWAATQHNLGTVLAILGVWESNTERLKEAKAAIESAYGFYKEAGDSQDDEYFEERLRVLDQRIAQ